jgi:hypothetical protein
LARAAAARDGLHAVSALAALGPPALSTLIELLDSPSADSSAACAAAVAELLSEHQPAKGVCAQVLAVLGRKLDSDVDTVHFVLLALGKLKPGEAMRADVRGRVAGWCRSADPRRRLLGFRALGSFSADLQEAELLAVGLEDEFDNVAWEAAVARVARGKPMTPRAWRRLCEAVAAGRAPATAWLAATIRADRDAAAARLAEHAGELEGYRLAMFASAARGDDEGVIAGVGSDFTSSAAVAALRVAGPMIAERFARIAALSGRDLGKLLVAVQASADLPDEVALPVLVRAADAGYRRGRPGPAESIVPSDAFRTGKALLRQVLARAARMLAPSWTPHRDIVQRLLQHPDREVRHHAADLLQRIDAAR